MDTHVPFASANIRALLAGLKTQMRWPAYHQILTKRTKNPGFMMMPTKWSGLRRGNRLWVREGFYTIHNTFGGYKINGAPPLLSAHRHPATHMPRNFSRLTLIVEEVKIEPLQSITEQDAEAEGVSFALEEVARNPWGDVSPDVRKALVNKKFRSHRKAFEWMWNRLHPDAATGAHRLNKWNDNPEVAVIRFVACQGNIDEMVSSSLAAE